INLTYSADDTCDENLDNVVLVCESGSVTVGGAEETTTTVEETTTTEATTTTAAPITEDNYVKVADVEANPGETVEVPVTITNNTGFAFIKLMFSYDPEVFEPVAKADIVKGDVMASGTMLVNIKGDDNFLFTCDDVANMTGDGVLVTITMKVKDTAPAGKAAINLTYSADDTCDENLDNVVLVCASGSVTVGGAEETTTTTEETTTTIPASKLVTYTIETVTVDSETGKIPADTTITAKVSISGAEKLSMVEFMLSYDNEALKAVGATVEGTLATFENNAATYEPVAPVGSTGEVWLTAMDAGVHSLADGETVMTVTFKTLKEVDADLALTVVRAPLANYFEDGEIVDLETKVVDGAIVINTIPTTTTEETTTTTEAEETTTTVEETTTTTEAEETTTTVEETTTTTEAEETTTTVEEATTTEAEETTTTVEETTTTVAPTTVAPTTVAPTTSTGSNNGPKTGDESNVMMVILIAGMAAAAVALSSVVMKKSKAK
ncbi:MAG: cohesin domain-containing protein, partial [Acutalibacteraceae bacterium]